MTQPICFDKVNNCLISAVICFKIFIMDVKSYIVLWL